MLRGSLLVYFTTFDWSLWGTTVVFRGGVQIALVRFRIPTESSVRRESVSQRLHLETILGMSSLFSQSLGLTFSSLRSGVFFLFLIVHVTYKLTVFDLHFEIPFPAVQERGD